jgi:ABC-type antimicrobial peptide transport system permease subunit
MVLPQISVVGKVNFNNSSTDMAVYAVTKDYLEQSAISPVIGDVFESNELTSVVSKVGIEKTSVVEEEIEDIVIASASSPKLIVKESNEGSLGEFVEVEGESDIVQTLQVTRAVLDKSITDLEAVVNRSFLKVLDIKENEAVGQTFSVTFIATGKLLGPDKNRLESMPIEYKIIGVTPDEKTPLFFVPFNHLKSLGLTNYSQLKMVVDKEQNLADARKKVESQGFSTSSVSDTVVQINNLFGTARTALALLGAVALSVAALGMFNTLTVSLLERTREIGLLKAMGMKSDEIKDLFLAESMIMGSLGGIFGLIFGLLVGKILEFILSIIALIGGAGMITVVAIPIPFAILIVVLSFLVGVLTGLYPASRATKISALNALRYE